MAEGFARVNARPSVLCRYYIHGACRMGDGCPFSHDSHSSQLSSTCRFYLKGICAYGDRCRYDHIRPERLETMRTNQNNENNQKRGKKDVKPVGSTVLSNKSTDKAKDKNEERRFTTLSTAFSKLCADAPEFVPRKKCPLPNNSANESLSYAVAAGSGTEPSTKQVEKSSPEDKSSSLCPFFQFSGECLLKDSCTYIHGLVCEFCQMACLHPADEEQRNKHKQQCMKDMEDEMEHSFAIARSKEKQCGICMETVWDRNLSTGQRFGILPKCSHCFCLDCIRKWRQSKQFDNKIVRSCPECRIQSDYIIPSRYWVDDKEKEEKQRLLGNYKTALGEKHCKYFKQGKGECPFGNKCFYLHALADGTLKDVGPPKKKKCVTNSSDLQTYLHNMILWEFLESRDERIENIQTSIETLIEDFERNDILGLIASEGQNWSDGDDSD